MKRPKLAKTPRLALVFLLVLAGCTLVGSGRAQASEVANSKKFGLGAILGQPTGLTLKYHFTPHHAITGALGVGWWGGQNFHIHVDYGYHFQLTKTADFDLVLWVGGGVKFFYYYWHYAPLFYDNDRHYDRAGFGLRVPVGIAFNLNRVPLEIFLEIAPGVSFVPWVNFFADGGIGVRYYF